MPERTGRILGPLPTAPRLQPSRLPAVRRPHRVLDLHGRRLVEGLIEGFARPLAQAVAQLSQQRLALRPLAGQARVRWAVSRRELEPAREPSVYHAVTADEPGDGPRVLWRFSGSLCAALLEALGLETDGLATRPLYDAELACLDAVVLDTLLEAPPGTPRRRLTYSCGVLGLPQRVLRSRDALCEVMLPFEASDPRQERVRTVLLEVALPLAVAPSWTPARSARGARSNLDRLARAVAPLVGWTLRLATLTLAASEVRRLAPGDVLMPAEPLRRVGDGGLAARLEAGHHAIDIHIELAATGPRLRLAQQPAAALREAQEPPMNRERERSDGSALEAALAEAPLELRIELGRLVLSAEQLLALQAGDVIEPALDGRSDGGVELWIGQRCVGYGELVELEGQLGVRVVRMAGASDDVG